MSFDFGPMQNLSSVQASAKSCPGGGGNTGYFQRGKKDEEEIELGFAKDYPEDSFTREEDLLEDNETSLIDNLKQMFLKFIAKIKALFIKKNPF